ncbi:VWA domain-containing protein [Cellulosimicrobium terreum]|nr:VWA domain-containing protein [Cellulosimicrobium terreum]
MRAARVVCVALLSALTLAPSAAVAETDAADLSEQGAEAFADLSACVATNGSLLATIVVDESGSLQQTDPADQRVGAVQAAIDALAALESADGGDVTVEANLAVFGSEYTELVGWGSPTGGHGQELLNATSDPLPWRDQENLTDYRAALRGAQASIDARTEELGQPTCSTILWFTDGKLDVGDEGEGEATAAAREELCVPQGVVDGVRANGTTIIALALFTEDSGGSVTEEDRDQLRAIAEGSAEDGTSCGTVPIPATSASGAYLRADQPDALRRLFSGAGALIEGGTPAGSFECPGESCVDGKLTFPVDQAVGSYRLIFETEDAADSVVLVAPDGSETALGEGESSTDVAQISTTTRSGLYVTDVTPTSDAAVGDWRLVTDPERVTVIDLYYFWGVELVLDAPDGLVLGEQNDVILSVQGTDGAAIDRELLDSVTGDVLVDGEPTEAQEQEDGTFAISVDLTGAEAASEIQVEATVRATSSPNEIALGPVTVQASLPTQLPPSYPTLATTRLAMGRLVGDDPATGTLTLTGSERGDTQACFAPADLAGPSDAGALTLDAPECVDVPADETVHVDVELTSERPADGVVSGTLPVTVSGVDAAQDVTLAVPVSSTMVRPVNELARWGIVAALVALGALIAGSVAWLGRRHSDRYPLGPDLRSASVPVELTAAGVRRSDGGELLVLDDFAPMHKPRPTARFETQGLAFDRHGSWWPWSPLHGRVRATSGSIVVTNGKHAQTLDPEGRAAPVDFPGTQQFYLVVDPAPVQGDPAAQVVRGRLVLLADTPRGIRSAMTSWGETLRDYQGWDRVAAAIADARAARGRTARETTAGAAQPPAQSTPRHPDGAAPSLFGPAGGPEPARTHAPDLQWGPPPPASRREPGPAPSGADDDGPPPSLF